jgi:hypothetical protein
MNIDSQISNFYKKLVIDELSRLQSEINADDDVLIDMACVALNRLPSRYYRYSVDMAFYLSAPEHQRMEDDVKVAVDYAVKLVTDNRSS